MTILKNKGGYAVTDRYEYGYEMRNYSMMLVVKDGSYFTTQVVTISLQYYTATDIWIAPKIAEVNIPLDSPYSRTDWANRTIQRKFNTYMKGLEIDTVSCDYDIHVRDFIWKVLNLEHYTGWEECCNDSYALANILNMKGR